MPPSQRGEPRVGGRWDGEDLPVAGWRDIQADVEQGRAKGECRRLVPALGGTDPELLGNGPVACMKADRALRTQAPFAPEAILEVTRAEPPERRVPCRPLFGFGFVRAGRGVPALHDLADEAGLQEALAVRPGQLIGADGRGGDRLQTVEGLSEFGGQRHR